MIFCCWDCDEEDVENTFRREFQNLSHIELGYVEEFTDKDTLEVLNLLEHCPRL